MTAPKCGFFWESYGPYHFARLDAVRKRFGEGRVIGIEISPQTTTYDWSRGSGNSLAVIPLVTDRAAEKVSGVAVYRRMREVIKQHSIEVLFIPSYWPLSSFVALVAAKRSGIRTIMMNDSHFLTGQNSAVALAIKSQLVKRFDAALVAGSIHRSFFRQLGLADNRIVEGYDTVDNDYFAAKSREAREQMERWRHRLALPDKFILSLGRFVKKKNLGLIIEAFAHARSQGKLSRHGLVFVGSGPEKEKLVSLAIGLNLPIVDHGVSVNGEWARAVEPEAVHFYPFAQIETTPVYYALASCFVLASRTDEWGLVVNEAMASGCPVVVSRFVGCATDLVIHGKTGYRFNPDNSEELSTRLCTICEDEAKGRALGECGQQHIGGWSNEQFAISAQRAAEIALWPEANIPRSVERTGSTVAILQTCFPDYREPVFEELGRRFDNRFSLVCGRSYFTPGVVLCPEFKDWQWPVQNTFLFFRNLLWQHGAIKEARQADVVVLELNPRILTNWLILLDRLFSGQRTLLWGHVWAREGVNAWTNFVRVMLMQLSDGVVSYTHTQARQLAAVLPRKPITVAPNSLISRELCRADEIGSADVTDIVYVGRMIADKKPMLLLQAFKIAAKQLPKDVRLILVGAGHELSELRNSAAQAQLGGRVVFRGHIHDHELLRAIYAKAYCAVSPGYVGLSAVQSFAYGVPMIVADDEPHSPEIETCREDFNTVFFQANEAAALAETLIRMWQEREAWRQRRSELSQWTAENYSTETMVDGFVAAIEKVSQS